MPEDPESIDVLVERFQSGIDQEESLRKIFEVYYPRFDRFFLRKGFSPEESQDLVQESFLQIYRGLPAFRHEVRFEIWAFQVLAHVYYNEIRKRSAGKRYGLEQELDSDRLAGQDSELLDVVLNKERIQALRDAIQRLPPRMRGCLMLRTQGGLKYREIATVLQISLHTVKSNIYLARKLLQKELGEAEEK